jgi:hypothetical protein
VLSDSFFSTVAQVLPALLVAFIVEAGVIHATSVVAHTELLRYIRARNPNKTRATPLDGRAWNLRRSVHLDQRKPLLLFAATMVLGEASSLVPLMIGEERMPDGLALTLAIVCAVCIVSGVLLIVYLALRKMQHAENVQLMRLELEESSADASTGR